MAYVKRLSPLGGSKALVIPKVFLDQIGVDEHQEVEIEMEGDRMVVTAHRYASDAAFTRSVKRVMTKHRKSLERLAR
jgi:antitoxin component of MazEF toxin-antitoxin module